MKESEKEDAMWKFSNEEEGSTWVDYSKESTIDLMHLNAKHFIEISDREDNE